MIQPSVAVMPGLGGWLVLDRTLARQQQAFARSPTIARDLEHMRARLPEVGTADDLLADFRLLKTVLGAFGLEEEAFKTAFLKRVLESDLSDERSFANRMVDPRFRELAATLGLGGGGTGPLDAPATLRKLKDAFVKSRFEAAVGAKDDTLRQALYAKRRLVELASGANAERSGWLSVMGDRALRGVIEGGLGLPSSIAKLGLERQQALFESAAASQFGGRSIKALAEPAALDKLIRRYLARNSTAATASMPSLLVSNGWSGAAGGAATLLAIWHAQKA